MANQYNWTIAALDYKPSEGDLTNVVVTVHWRLGVDNGVASDDASFVSTDICGAESFKLPSDSSSFIPFDQLTKETVVGWLEGKLDVDTMKTNLDSALDNIINPPILTASNPF